MSKDPRPRFTRLDGRLEPFDPEQCISDVLKRLKWGDPELARLELPDGRVVEQRGRDVLGFKGREYGEHYHADYHEIPGPPAVNSQAQASLASDGDTGPNETSLRFSPGVRDILETLAESKGRVTRERLLEAMAQAGRRRGESFVRNTMPKLVEAGLVDNRQDRDPNGYAITKEGRRRLRETCL